MFRLVSLADSKHVFCESRVSSCFTLCAVYLKSRKVDCIILLFCQAQPSLGGAVPFEPQAASDRASEDWDPKLAEERIVDNFTVLACCACQCHYALDLQPFCQSPPLSWRARERTLAIMSAACPCSGSHACVCVCVPRTPRLSVCASPEACLFAVSARMCICASLCVHS